MGSHTSAREPKRIMRITAPARIVSPGRGATTARRATAAAICRRSKERPAVSGNQTSLRWFVAPTSGDTALRWRPGFSSIVRTVPGRDRIQCYDGRSGTCGDLTGRQAPEGPSYHGHGCRLKRRDWRWPEQRVELNLVRLERPREDRQTLRLPGVRGEEHHLERETPCELFPELADSPDHLRKRARNARSVDGEKGLFIRGIQFGHNAVGEA
jgi:hypothetical protein